MVELIFRKKLAGYCQISLQLWVAKCVRQNCKEFFDDSAYRRIGTYDYILKLHMVAGYFIGYATAAHLAKLTLNVKQCQSYKERNKERNETTFGILNVEYTWKGQKLGQKYAQSNVCG